MALVAGRQRKAVNQRGRCDEQVRVGEEKALGAQKIIENGRLIGDCFID